MPKEKASLLAMFLGDEPGPIARLCHEFSGADEGSWGEKCIVELLKNRTDNAPIFQNVYVPNNADTNHTTELDVVAVGQTGLYIFESKAYGGKIYGTPDQLNWVQYLGGVKNSFYNPVRQNENHRRNLAKALNVPLETIFSFVVFENRADLSNVYLCRGQNFVVCNRKPLLKMFKKVAASRPTVFSPDEQTDICNQLEQWCNVSNATKQQHVEQIQQKFNGDTCPFCGRTLVERRGKYGPFMGCSGYPRCRYTRKI